MLGPAAALLGGEGAVRVDVGLEPGQEGGAAARSRLPRVVLRVHGVGGKAGAEGPLRW